jgi:predicted ArsR family transcriptional regulator
VDPRQWQAIDEVAVLVEPVRRALYSHVVEQAGPVGRDAAAAAVGIGRPLAAFHLDRLVRAGLLDVTYRRLSGRSGPGAGRPAKLYRRSGREVELTLPARRYDLAARLFAHALSTASAGSTSTAEALDTAARSFGERLGQEARRRAGPRPGRQALLTAATDVLREAGFEPATASAPVVGSASVVESAPVEGSAPALGTETSSAAGQVIVLRNCPFDALAQTHRQLVCGMNLSLMEGVIDGLRATGITATLDPQPGMCCVVWRRG